MMPMRRTFAALLLAPLLAAAQPAETLFNLVTLSAQAEREVPNDLLTAVLAADQEGTDPARLADSVNRTMQRALGIAQGYRGIQARSGNYQTYPIHDKGRIVRWRVRQELRLESGDFAAMSELIGKLQATLVLAGTTLSVSAEARRQAENALISQALAAFDERARVVREAMKSKAHRVRDLQITGGDQPRPVLSQMRTMTAESVAPPAIEAGTTRITMSVTGTIQLQ
jgi:predicted secreted protein